MIDVRNRLLFSLCLLMFLVPVAGAQTVTYEDQVNLYHPTATGELGLFTAIAGETLRQGDWSLSLYWNEYDYLAADPLPSMRIPSRRSFREMDLDESRITASIGYGLTDRWEIVAMIPYSKIESNAGDLSGFVNGYPYSGEFDDSGMGNLHIGTKLALTDPNVSDSRLALSLFADLPTGDEDSGISSGSTDYGIGLHWNRGIWVAGGQYKIRGDRDASDNPMGFDVSLSDEVRLDLGTNIPLNFWGTTNWINELNAIVYTGGDEPRTGARVRFECLQPVQQLPGDDSVAIGAPCSAGCGDGVCDPQTNTCQQGCSNDADCNSAGLVGWKCNQAEPRFCQNPTCS
ncbi:MAG: hypothetical protein KY432_10470 [Acidobacteria bacterium]|nr:hypothetical protein [Acidobacteriota bacterium]